MGQLLGHLRVVKAAESRAFQACIACPGLCLQCGSGGHLEQAGLAMVGARVYTRKGAGSHTFV